MIRMLDFLNAAPAFVPVDMKTAANSGDWVNLKHYGRVVVLLFKGVGDAAEPAILELKQATDNAGAGAKALSIKKVYTKLDADGLNVAAWTEADPTTANTYNATGNLAGLVAFEVRAEDLDVNGGFTHIQVNVADVGAVAQLGGVLYLFGNPRYPDAPANAPDVTA